jgi:hypothetical protein
MGTLLSLKWNAKKQCFECEGYEVTFYLEYIFGQTAPNNSLASLS